LGVLLVVEPQAMWVVAALLFELFERGGNGLLAVAFPEELEIASALLPQLPCLETALRLDGPVLLFSLSTLLPPGKVELVLLLPPAGTGSIG